MKKKFGWFNDKVGHGQKGSERENEDKEADVNPVLHIDNDGIECDLP
jgi:hypothetical protein